MAFNEKRKSKREVVVDGKIYCRISNAYTADILNISNSGVAAYVENPIYYGVGEYVKVTIFSKENKELAKVYGNVVRLFRYKQFYALAIEFDKDYLEITNVLVYLTGGLREKE